MTDVASPSTVTFWLPGRTEAPPETPVVLAGRQPDVGLRLQATRSADVCVRELRGGVFEVVFRTLGEPLGFTVTIPATDAAAWWRPGSTVPHATIPPSWEEPSDATALRGLPIGALLATHDVARLVYAVDAGTSVTRVRAGLVEETADFAIMVTVGASGTSDHVRLLLDASGRSFVEAVPEAGRWLQGEEGHRAAPGAEDPVLCTWYFAHQHVTAATVLAQADRAVAMGFGTVIIDDGWQTNSHERGYGSCGDWEAAEEKFPDAAGLVEALRGRGLRTVWWVGTPFLGHQAKARHLGLSTLRDRPELQAEVLDPRDPSTRAYLVGRMEEIIARTAADGLKLDFLEEFEDQEAPGSVAAAVDTMSEIVDRLRGLGTEPLIEFREPYVHPAVGRFASMIRVGDCPLNAVQNRVGILDLRLARPGTPIHSDPIMWAEGDSPERVAHHLINALLGVPQISMDLVGLPGEQSEALAFWLGVWREYRDLLLHGRLAPERPDLLYPVARVHDGGRHLVARYAPHTIKIPEGDWTELLVANADDSPPILLHEGDEVRAGLEIWDARGRQVADGDVVLGRGPSVLTVPSGGLARLRRPTTAVAEAKWGHA
ncbi:alpha-galactosidase [Planotetraspora sp. A-T 1434]|uniref:alpha-galactosidase n=1 Tax=Planotetraspora sp. A-T 1434 TaxID=2979219 RepID=UPI0021C033E6|nr:alpha-galactosidase [Planotetraspora sp. A-T 1434]MCT9933750.1 alpha-galactosidase [Planotetraspora sp. A-T 1434]